MIRDPDLIVTRLDALPWLAKLTQDGPLVTCKVCRQEAGSTWGYQENGGKVGLHLWCVETGLAQGKLVDAKPATAVADGNVSAWVWARLAGWYDH